MARCAARAPGKGFATRSDFHRAREEFFESLRYGFFGVFFDSRFTSSWAWIVQVMEMLVGDVFFLCRYTTVRVVLNIVRLKTVKEDMV